MDCCVPTEKQLNVACATMWESGRCCDRICQETDGKWCYKVIKEAMSNESRPQPQR